MTEETPQSNDRSCRDPYRPYRLPWWGVALALYVIVYWFFGVLVQNVNLLGPVSWIEWINARSLVPLLPQPASPFFRLIINLFNPLVLLHIAGPLMVGLYFAGQTAACFMKEFYGFATQKQAAGFLRQLRAADSVRRFMAPKSQTPLKVTREDFEKLRNENAWLRVGGPGSILLGGGYLTAVTESNGRFCRVLGSGAQRLGAYEYIHSLVDLRQHERQGRQSFVTRDGLKVDLNVAVTFRIASNDAVLESPPAATMPSAQGDNVTRPTTTALFPYGPDAVKMAAYVKTVLDDEGKQINDWQQLPLIIAQGELGKRISALRYDELFAPDQPDQQPHPELLAEVLHAAQFALQRGRTGIHLLNLRLGPVLAVDARMTGEHIMTWRAFWEKQGRMREAQSEAQAITEMAEARREAEQMIISAIIEGIEQAQEQYGEEVTRRIVALRIVDTLGRLANVSQQISAPARAALIQQLAELRDSIRAEAEPAEGTEGTA